MASIQLVKASGGSGNANVATVQNIRSSGATTIIVDTVLGINTGGFAGTMGTPHTFTDPVTGETITVISTATAVDFVGHVNSGHLEIDTIAPGYTDLGSAVGDIVVVRPTTQYADNLAALLAVNFNDDGSLKTGIVATAKIADSAVDYTKVAAGAVVQRVAQSYSTFDTTTTIIPWDNTIPQNTEGKQFMSLAITPKSATNILVIEVLALTSNGNATQVHIGAIFQDTTANALAANAVYTDAGTIVPKPLNIKHAMVAGTTSSTTFKVRLGPHQVTTLTFNGNNGADILGNIPKSIITITEYKA